MIQLDIPNQTKKTLTPGVVRNPTFQKPLSPYNSGSAKLVATQTWVSKPSSLCRKIF